MEFSDRTICLRLVKEEIQEASQKLYHLLEVSILLLRQHMG